MSVNDDWPPSFAAFGPYRAYLFQRVRYRDANNNEVRKGEGSFDDAKREVRPAALVLGPPPFGVQEKALRRAPHMLGLSMLGLSMRGTLAAGELERIKELVAELAEKDSAAKAAPSKPPAPRWISIGVFDGYTGWRIEYDGEQPDEWFLQIGSSNGEWLSSRDALIASAKHLRRQQPATEEPKPKIRGGRSKP